ncbi:TOBE domain-containing protein, partial [Mesorhizobium sp. M7A.F.Ca.US.003.02.2.1]
VMKGGVIQQLDAPQTIYNRPVNRFVAGFLGSPAMNFVDGHLEDADGGWRFAAGDIKIPLGTYDFAKPPAPGPVTFGIRPEHVSLNSGTGWPFSTAANVEVVEPMGSDTLVWLKLAQQNFSVRVTSERTPKNDEAVTLGFDPMRASLFDTATGTRI